MKKSTLLIDKDDCLPEPCQHEGICTDVRFNYTCNCTSGWTGHDCSIGRVLIFLNCVTTRQKKTKSFKS